MSLRIVTTSKRLVATITKGLFLKILELADSFGASEAIAKAFGRPVSDSASASELKVLEVGKSLTDTSSASEDKSLDVGKSLADSSSVAEAIDQFDFGKNPSDTSIASESHRIDITKLLTDTAFVTDDLDGETSIEDDQEMQFFKSLSEAPAVTSLFERAVDYSRSFSNASSMTDDDVLVIGKNINEFIGLPETVEKDFDKSPSENPIVVDLAALALSRSLSDSGSIDETSVKLVGKNLGDAASVGDSGSFRGQGYSDFTYFADDYVGFAGTFN